MKTNTLTLLSAVSLSVLLAACGGGGGGGTATSVTGSTTTDTTTTGSTSDTPSTTPDTGPTAIPASWVGTWHLKLDECLRSFNRADSAGGGVYYTNENTTTIDSDKNTMTIVGNLYNDDQCSNSAGTVKYAYDSSQLAVATLDNFQDARAGVITATDITLAPGITPAYPDKVGIQTNFLGGLNANGSLCTTASKQERPASISAKFCAQKQ